MSDVADRYRARADRFETLVAHTRPEQWDNQSPCDDWDARAVVGHIVIMHGVMLASLGRELSPGPALDDDPLGAFRSARADVESLLADPDVARSGTVTPMGPMPFEQHVDGVVSADLVLHGWDLARATEQDDTIDPAEVAAMLPGAENIAPEMRIPEAFGPGVIVFGPVVEVGEDATPQQRLLALMGRDPFFRP